MKKPRTAFLVLSIALADCSSEESPMSGGGSTSGSVTTGATGTATSGNTVSGSTGTPGTGGATDVGSTSATSGTGGAGGNVSGGTGGGVPGDASDDDGGAGGSDGGGAGSTGAGGAAGRYGWYEAEAVPPNQLYGRAVKATCQACPSLDTIKPGDACCSGGGEVNWIVSGGKGPDPQPPDGRGGGELRYNAYSDQPGHRFQSDVGTVSGALGHRSERSDDQMVRLWLIGPWNRVPSSFASTVP